MEQCYEVPLPEEVDEEDNLLIVDKMQPLRDAVYIKLNLREVAMMQNHLNSTKQNLLTKSLLKHKGLFQGWCGNGTGDPVTIHLCDGAKTFYGKHYNIPMKNQE